MSPSPILPSFIQINAVRKHFGSVVALQEIDLSIREGEFFSLLGPSGCGKTTLLRILSGLEFPTSGSVVIDGVDVSYLPPYRRPTNLVFQSYAIFPHLTVAENIAYGLRRRALNYDERTSRVDKMLAVIGLEGFGLRRPNQLSGGQLQRVALARALVLKPKVLLLDEPLAALDKKLRERMQLELRAIQREVGITFVLVTHDQEEALTLSDRVAVMAEGKIVQCSPPSELYKRPIDRFVAEFVGRMNFLPGRVKRVERAGAIVELPGLGEIKCELSGQVMCGSSVELAIRPEFLSITREGTWKGRIVNRSFYGERCHARVAVSELPDLLTVSVSGSSEFNDGDEVQVEADLTHAVFLEGGR